jgi:putative membrane protein
MPDEEPEQISLMRRLIDMSAERTYLNAERTLSVWVRTALGLMILGLAVDRFRLFLFELPAASGRTALDSNALSNWVGVALVALGVAMAVATGLRFLAYAAAYRRQYPLPLRHGPFLGPFFALMAAAFGVAVLVILLIVH